MTVMVSERRHQGTGSSLNSWIYLIDPKDHILKVSCWWLYWKCVKNGGSFMWVLEDVEGSWQETWRTGSALMSWKYLVDPKHDILKVLCWYFDRKCVKNRESFIWVLGGHWGFLSGYLNHMVIFDVMEVLVRTQESYPTSFVFICLL